jgi:cobalt/nickel transport protein
MMIGKYKLELITGIVLVAFIAIFLSVSAGGSHAFGGSDDLGSQKVAELTGHPVESFRPLIPQYEPPSGEIESTLFALQAAFGGAVLGLVFGYWLGQRRTSSKT